MDLAGWPRAIAYPRLPRSGRAHPGHATPRSMVANGHVLVLGSLIDDQLRSGEQRVPVLGRLPGIGALFRPQSTELVKAAAREVSGTPTATGSGTATVTATDTDGDTATLQFTWSVAVSHVHRHPQTPPPRATTPWLARRPRYHVGTLDQASCSRCFDALSALLETPKNVLLQIPLLFQRFQCAANVLGVVVPVNALQDIQ